MKDGAGISIYFKSEPVYNIGYCEVEKIPQSKLGADKNRIWTIERENTRVKLSCNGVQIFDFDIQLSTKDECKKRWTFKSEILRFVGQINQGDTASDFFRQYTAGTIIDVPLILILYD